MRQIRHFMQSLPIAALAVAGALAAPATASAAPSAATPQTITVNAGGGVTGIAAEGFFPQSVTISPGDTIHFVNPGQELHTVTYLPAGMAMPALIVQDPGGSPAHGFNPVVSTTSPPSPATFDATKLINSGILMKGNTYDVQFPSSGTFVFHCAFHPMQLTVNVVSSGTRDSQATVDARAAAELNTTLTAGQAAVGILQGPAVTGTKLADGSTDWQIYVGGDANVPNSTDSADVMQFFPPNISVKQGDTITWTNTQDVPHTVTFLSGAAPPAIIAPIPQKSGPPFLAFSPQVALAMGGTTYNGTGFVSSGLFGPGNPNPSTFSVKFTAAGTFTYICLLHGDQGMTGTVTVGAAAAASTTPATAVTAPNTGTGPAADGNDGIVYAIALLAALSGGALVVAGRRRMPARIR